MKRRFMVAVDDSTKEQQNIITEFLRVEEGIGFWHYFSDIWLIADPSEKWTAVELRSKVAELVPGATVLVLKVESGTGWAAFGKKGIFKWMHETWKKD